MAVEVIPAHLLTYSPQVFDRSKVERAAATAGTCNDPYKVDVYTSAAPNDKHTLTAKNAQAQADLIRWMAAEQSTSLAGRGKTMLNEITADLRGFLKEHKDWVYTILFVLLLDHFVFNGAFRDRLRVFVENLLHATEQRMGVKKQDITAAAVKVE